MRPLQGRSGVLVVHFSGALPPDTLSVPFQGALPTVGDGFVSVVDASVAFQGALPRLADGSFR